MGNKKNERIDCYACTRHCKLYDRNAKVRGHWCSARNGKLKKRFRGDCQFVAKGGNE